MDKPQLWILIHQHGPNSEFSPVLCEGDPHRVASVAYCPLAEDDDHDCDSVEILGKWDLDDIPIIPAEGDAHACDDCDNVYARSELVTPIPRLEERLDPNGPAPTGECPDCGALAYLIEDNL